QPANAFVAGFVGVSNVLQRDGRVFTVRPEKIRILRDGEAPGDLRVETGVVSDTTYTGDATRYHVALDEGGELEVVRQNLDPSHDDARRLRGTRISVGWLESQTVGLAGEPEPPAEAVTSRQEVA